MLPLLSAIRYRRQFCGRHNADVRSWKGVVLSWSIGFPYNRTFYISSGFSDKSQLLIQQGEYMIYLIISLVAGLVYLISGKVKYNKTIYLEGRKARIAGLIFLSPVVLILALLITVFILEIFGINISESSSKLVDNFASTLVRNVFMIGLAYINFYSVSRETKNRGGCLTYWLAYAAVIALLVIYFVPNIVSNTQWFKNASIGITVFQIIFIIGIWLWKKWGVFGYAVTTMMTPVVAFIRVESISQAFISLIQSLSLILVLYLLVKPKWQFFE